MSKSILLSQFQAIGHQLFDHGLIVASSGNLSIRLGDRLIITRHDSRLGFLEEYDLIETGIYQDDSQTPFASVELPVHRAIYQVTPVLAIVHAHPVYAVTLSLASREIVIAGLDTVPVIGWKTEVKPGGLGDLIAQGLTRKRTVMVYGHGNFTTGQSLEEACNYTLAFEEHCRVLCSSKSIERESSKES